MNTNEFGKRKKLSCPSIPRTTLCARVGNFSFPTTTGKTDNFYQEHTRRTRHFEFPFGINKKNLQKLLSFFFTTRTWPALETSAGCAHVDRNNKKKTHLPHTRVIRTRSISIVSRTHRNCLWAFFIFFFRHIRIVYKLYKRSILTNIYSVQNIFILANFLDTICI